MPRRSVRRPRSPTRPPSRWRIFGPRSLVLSSPYVARQTSVLCGDRPARGPETVTGFWLRPRKLVALRQECKGANSKRSCAIIQSFMSAPSKNACASHSQRVKVPSPDAYRRHSADRDVRGEPNTMTAMLWPAIGRHAASRHLASSASRARRRRVRRARAPRSAGRLRHRATGATSAHRAGLKARARSQVRTFQPRTLKLARRRPRRTARRGPGVVLTWRRARKPFA